MVKKREGFSYSVIEIFKYFREEENFENTYVYFSSNNFLCHLEVMVKFPKTILIYLFDKCLYLINVTLFKLLVTEKRWNLNKLTGTIFSYLAAQRITWGGLKSPTACVIPQPISLWLNDGSI